MDILKSIYIITNQINRKQYIGQSVHPEIRFKEHCQNSCQYNSLIHAAIQKYGKENFSIKILEKDISNYDEREQYWIQFYNTLIPYGYNISKGGEYRPEIKTGEDSYLAKYTNQQFSLIIQLLLNNSNNQLTAQEIANLTGTSKQYVLAVNNGEARASQRSDEFIYPLYNYYIKVTEEVFWQIVTDLSNKELTQKEIANKYHIGNSIVSSINTGKLHYHSDISYPIRKKRIKTRWGYNL